MLVTKTAIVILISLPWIPGVLGNTRRHLIARNSASGNSSYASYTSSWISNHESWFSISHGEIRCLDTVNYPTCIDNRQIGTQNDLFCPSFTCSPGKCVPTPQDTIDFLPPPLADSLDKSQMCIRPDGAAATLPPYYGFDSGVPPMFNTLASPRLRLSGIVRAQLGTTCPIIANAEVDAWHVDPSRYSKPNELKSSFGKSEFAISQSLRSQSCRGRFTTPEDGSYVFHTVIPPSYGPPRHINIMVTAEGYETLITRVYFGDDWRLLQLSILHGEEEELFVDGLSGLDSKIGFKKNQRLPDAVGILPDDDRYQHIFPGNIGKDPRVVRVTVNDSDPANIELNAEFHIFLKPLRPLDSLTPDSVDITDAAQSEWRASGMPATPEPPLDLSGLWSEETGGLVLVETKGNMFIAAEYPHPRRWGTVFGALFGDTIRGVDFRGLNNADGILADLQRLMQLGFLGEALPLFSALNQQLLWRDGDNSSFFDVGIKANDATLSSNNNVDAIFDILSDGGRGPALTTNSMWSTTMSTGVVLSEDPFNTDITEARIEWSGDPSDQFYKQYWSKYTQDNGYRYLKLEITRETGGYKGGRLEINEIQFFEGAFAQTEYPRPDLKMKSPRTPNPQLVSCSTFRDQPSHCFRAFDGNPNSSSAWVTIAEGSRRHQLVYPQWILFDFGEGLGLRPTSMKIVCGASNPFDALGCPMTFKLMGSHDNILFHTLLNIDMYDYSNGYSWSDAKPNLGLTFDFFWETPLGRENGHRCGSCDTAPDFVCSTGAFDSTCASKYCGIGGYCESFPLCSPGYYLATSPAAVLNFDVMSSNRAVDKLAVDKRMTATCSPCAAGRFGATSGLLNSNCSGTCSAGYYCAGASVTPTQHACGDPSVFCPEGSGPGPILVGAGERGVGVDVFHQNDTALCEPGHYCRDGIQIMCRAGRYGSSSGLQTPDCTGVCLSGEYCPEGSVNPTLCPKGYYCTDGNTKAPCPAGRYGARTGLQDESCSGNCQIGYYCPEGSVSRTQIGCPAGRFGSIPGLKDSTCTGLCRGGYYCPVASISETAKKCGGPGVYCPIGSPAPIPVSFGFYSTGGYLPNDAETRSNQTQCEPGYYCLKSQFPQLFDPSGVSLRQYLSNVDLFNIGRSEIDGNIDLSQVETYGSALSVKLLSASGWKGGIKLPCPPGSYGSVEGLVSTTASSPTSTSYGIGLQKLANSDVFQNADISDFQCSGLCEPGYYCPLNSTSSQQVPCPVGRFGAVQGLIDDSCTAVCPIGHFCPMGTVEPIFCPAGVFGNVTGLTDSSCSTDCWLTKSGPEAAAESREGLASGETRDFPGSICSPKPNACFKGFYCPEGSISGTQMECGSPDVYCPSGSALPTPVRQGYYSLPVYYGKEGPSEFDGRRQEDEAICPLGYFCIRGLKVLCPQGTFGSSLGLFTAECSGPCPRGFYCPEGSFNGTYHRCPAGRYGGVEGLASSACSGVCLPGYYCEEASTSPTQYQCGYSLPKNSSENSVYCPISSSAPLSVQIGYYSIGFNRTTRSDQLPCPAGSYCTNGIIKDCPAGRYGAVPRLSSELCSGPCRRGHYCPPGSIASNEVPCPIGRFGSEEGLTSPSCSGSCPYPELCPEGSEINYDPAHKIRSNML